MIFKKFSINFKFKKLFKIKFFDDEKMIFFLKFFINFIFKKLFKIKFLMMKK